MKQGSSDMKERDESRERSFLRLFQQMNCFSIIKVSHQTSEIRLTVLDNMSEVVPVTLIDHC